MTSPAESKNLSLPRVSPRQVNDASECGKRRSVQPASARTSRRRLLRRLMGLGIRYRGACVAMVALQVLLVVLALAGFGLTGEESTSFAARSRSRQSAAELAVRLDASR
ncbi:MAG: hypothetical protein U0992_19910 [Planctomycetaceae bacterium]